MGCVQRKTNFEGADIGHFVSVNGIPDCINRCKIDSKCKSFTFNRADKRCWLKNKENGDRAKSSRSKKYRLLTSLNMSCLNAWNTGSCMELADYQPRKEEN